MYRQREIEIEFAIKKKKEKKSILEVFRNRLNYLPNSLSLGGGYLSTWKLHL